MDAIIIKKDLEHFLSLFKSHRDLYETQPIDKEHSIFTSNYNDEINDFCEYAYSHNWVRQDYDMISESWNKASNKIDYISTLNQENTLRLIAWHIRGDRFCSGLLGFAFKDGFIQAAINQLLLLEKGHL